MALTSNLIIFDPDLYDPPGDLSGAYLFDDILGSLQPKAVQLEVLARLGVDGEEMRETGVRALPSQIRTVHAFATRGDALDALEEYLTLIDGNPYEVIQHDESYGFFRVLGIVNLPLLPLATAAGYIVANPTILQVLDWTLVGTEAPEAP